MDQLTLVKTIVASFVVYGLLLVHPFSAAAQETTPAPRGKSAGEMGMPGMMGHEHGPGMMGDMQKMHEQMEKMDQEASQELQKQMTALRDHTKTMEGMSDEKQLLMEMRKHQQMTDVLLGTMLEQKEKMHTQMQKHHEQMHGSMGKDQPSEGGGTEPSGEHEQHHNK